MLRRRTFTAGALALAAAPLAARAQQLPARVVFYSGSGSEYVAVFLRSLNNLGWVDGRNMIFRRVVHPVPFDEREQDRLLGDLFAFKPDIIVAPGTTDADFVLARTRTIPVVFAIVGDPVAQGLVSSYSRPGGNATGGSVFGPEIAAKNLQLFQEVVPSLAQVGVIYGRDTLPFRMSLPARTAAAEKLGMTLRPRPLVKLDDIEAAFDAAHAEGDQGVIVVWDNFTIENPVRIASNAARVGMPAFYGERRFVDGGGLISYAAKISESYERAASFVDKILRGAKPGDLPIEQARSFELVVNLKAASAIGVTFPETILLRADAIVE